MVNPLDAWKQHAMASEEMDLTGAGSHQKKGYNFAQNFPSLVPSGVQTPISSYASLVGPGLSKAYQYAQELGRSMFDTDRKNYTLADAWKKAGVESDANIQGMLGKGFDEDEYNDWMAQHGYGPEHDFSGIKGQTAMLGLPQLFGMITKGGISKQAIKKALIRNQIGKQIGKKVRPSLVKKLREKLLGEKFGGTGKFKTIATGTKDYGPHTKTKVITRPKSKPYVSPARPHGNGGGGGGTTRRHTGHGKSGMGRAPKDSMADGGLINFYRYGGFI